MHQKNTNSERYERKVEEITKECNGDQAEIESKLQQSVEQFYSDEEPEKEAN